MDQVTDMESGSANGESNFDRDLMDKYFFSQEISESTGDDVGRGLNPNQTPA